MCAMASHTFSYRLPLLAALLGFTFIGAVELASARSLESQEDLLRGALESFTATLRTESEKLAGRAAETAQGAETTFGNAAERVAEEVARALSEQKDTLGTIGRDLSAQLKAWKDAELDAWRDAMGESWFKMHHAMIEMLGQLNEWLRMPSEPDANQEIPV
jgi:hypothetical protein